MSIKSYITKRDIFIKMTPTRKYVILITEARANIFFLFSKIPRTEAVTHRERRYLKNDMSPRDIIIPNILAKRLYSQPVDENVAEKKASPKGFKYVRTLACENRKHNTDIMIFSLFNPEKPVLALTVVFCFVLPIPIAPYIRI